MWNTLWLIVSQPVVVVVLSKGFGQVNITFRLFFVFHEARLCTSVKQTTNSRRQHHGDNSGIIDRPNKRLLGYSHVRDYAEGCALQSGGWQGDDVARFVAGVERLVKYHPRWAKALRNDSNLPQKLVIDPYRSMLLHVARLKTGAQLGDLFASEWCWCRELRKECRRIGPCGV